MRQYLHDRPIWASPNISAYLHVDSTDYFEQYMLHYVPSSQYCIFMLSEHGGGAHLGRHSVTVDGHEMCCGYCMWTGSVAQWRVPCQHGATQLISTLRPAIIFSNLFLTPVLTVQYPSSGAHCSSHSYVQPLLPPHKPGKSNANVLIERAEGSGNYYFGLKRSMACGRDDAVTVTLFVLVRLLHT